MFLAGHQSASSQMLARRTYFPTPASLSHAQDSNSLCSVICTPRPALPTHWSFLSTKTHWLLDSLLYCTEFYACKDLCFTSTSDRHPQHSAPCTVRNWCGRSVRCISERVDEWDTTFHLHDICINRKDHFRAAFPRDGFPLFFLPPLTWTCQCPSPLALPLSCGLYTCLEHHRNGSQGVEHMQSSCGLQ